MKTVMKMRLKSCFIFLAVVCSGKLFAEDVTCGPPPEIAGGRIAGTKRSRYNPGESAEYQCWKNFTMTGNSTVMCQNGNWTELPTCTGKLGTCGKPSAIQSGELLVFPLQEHQHGDILEYKCPNFYTLVGSPTITCLNGQWTDPPVCLAACTASEEDMERNNIELKWMAKSKLYIVSGAYAEFRCKEGYLEDPSASSFRAQCVEGTLKYPRCTLGKIICDVPEILHGYVRSPKKAYKENELMQFFCEEGYKYSNRADTQCTESGWNPPPSCTEIVCSPPVISSGNFRPQKDKYTVGDSITVECDDGYHFKVMTGRNSETAECTKDGWVPEPACVRKPCDYPVIENGKLTDSEEYNRDYYFPKRFGQSVYYTCHDGYSTPTGDNWVLITCSERGWLPEPKCLRKLGTCGKPPVIQSGELLVFPLPEYQHGDILEYKCPNFYTLVGSPTITCLNGQWTDPPVCLVACTASEEDMERNNIELKWTTQSKLHTSSGDFIEFRCKEGYLEATSASSFRAQCVEGTLKYPRCTLGRNCALDRNTMERNHIQLQSSGQSSHLFHSGDPVVFECWPYYLQVSHGAEFRTQCLDGVIRYPRCESMWSYMDRIERMFP